MKLFNINNRFILTLILSAVLSATIYSAGKQELPVIAYQDRVGDSAAILAARELSDAGQFEVKRFSSGGLCAEALLSGTADFATMGDAVAVRMASRYPESIVLLGIHGEGAGRHRLVKTTDVPGTIGVKFGTSTHSALLTWLGMQEVNIRNAMLIDMSPSTQIAALASGEVDALAASEPTPSVAHAKIVETAVASLEVEGRNFPIVLATTRKALEKYPGAAEIIENELMQQAENISGETDYLSEITGLQDNILLKSLELHNFGYYPVSGYFEELDKLAAFMVEQGNIEAPPVWSMVVR